MADEVVTKRGWLKKQGGIVKSWSTKWFVIKGNKMLYFAKEEEGRIQGSIDLLGYRISEVTYSKTESDKWLFELNPVSKTGSSPETYLLCAANEQEKQEWVVAIRRVLYKEQGGGVFGQSLEETMAYNTTSKVPHVVEDCVEYLRIYGLESEGILRLSGRTLLIKEIRKKYDEGKRPNFVAEEVDIHTVSSVFKMYFRELPEPVIPFNAFHQFLDLATSFKFQSNNKETFCNLRRLLKKLPVNNYNLLEYLVTFLGEIDERSALNKMPMTNLGLIFGTHILREENSSPELQMGTHHLTTHIVLALIKWHKDLFSNDDVALDGLPVPDLISFADVDTAPQSACGETNCSLHSSSRAVESDANCLVKSVNGLDEAASEVLPSDHAADATAVPRALSPVTTASVLGGESAACVPNIPQAGSVLLCVSGSFPPNEATSLRRCLSETREPPAPVVIKRSAASTRRGDRPACILPLQQPLPADKATEATAAAGDATFCSYIKSGSMTPCLDNMPTSVNDLQALVYSLRLVIREQQDELSIARKAVAELKSSNDEAVNKVVMLQARLVEYESQFGVLRMFR